MARVCYLNLRVIAVTTKPCVAASQIACRVSALVIFGELSNLTNTIILALPVLIEKTLN